MRIIAGNRRGAQLYAPRGMETRPTLDRVKESLFSIIQADLPDASVLDLFSGSGALSLESLSRGARRAVLVDKDREALQCIHRNIEKLRCEALTDVLALDWRRAVTALGAKGDRFSLVFLDPPYRMEDFAAFRDALTGAGLLTDQALIVWEHRSGLIPPDAPGFSVVNERRYHDTEIHFLRYKEVLPS